MSIQPTELPRFVDEATSAQLPHPDLWRKLLSNNRDQIADAVAQIHDAGLADDYAGLLLIARRRHVRYARRLFGLIPLTTPYTERERRSALTALGVLWGAMGREVGMALDPKTSHFDREQAHKALSRRRDQRATRPLIDALLSGHAVEDWRCIQTLVTLGDARAADALATYIGLNAEVACIPDSAVSDIALDIGRALRDMNAREMLKVAQEALHSPLPHQRTGAVLIIAGWGDESLAPLLVPLVEDRIPMVRLAAINALGELKAAASLLPLQAVVTDPDPAVRIAVEQALEQVTAANARRAAKSKTGRSGSKR